MVRTYVEAGVLKAGDQTTALSFHRGVDSNGNCVDGTYAGWDRPVGGGLIRSRKYSFPLNKFDKEPRVVVCLSAIYALGPTHLTVSAENITKEGMDIVWKMDENGPVAWAIASLIAVGPDE